MIKHVHDPRYIALVDWLKTARMKQGLTVRQLAALIDEPHQFVVKIETRERKLGVFEYWQFCKVMGLDPAEGLMIMDIIPNPQPHQQGSPE